MARFYFVKEELKAIVSELLAGLSNLSFLDNFKGFEWSGLVPGGEEVLIPNRMSPQIPKGFVVTDVRFSNSLVRGARAWDTQYVSIKSTDPTASTEATIFFHR